jgi:hypothetical protein
MASQIVFRARVRGITVEAIAVFSGNGCGAAAMPGFFSCSSKFKGWSYVQFCTLKIMLLFPIPFSVQDIFLATV